MNICVTSTGPYLNSEIDPRFGRANYFIIVNATSNKVTVLENNVVPDLPQGSGIQAGKTIVDKGVDILITGSCGPKAYRVLRKAGIEVVTGARGTVSDMVERWKVGSETGKG